MSLLIAIVCFVILITWGKIEDRLYMKKPKGDMTAFWDNIKRHDEQQRDIKWFKDRNSK